MRIKTMAILWGLLGFWWSAENSISDFTASGWAHNEKTAIELGQQALHRDGRTNPMAANPFTPRALLDPEDTLDDGTAVCA